MNTETKYLHYRHFNKKTGEVEPRRGATVAYRVYPDGSLRFAVAAVHHRDNFSRRLGRFYAGERLRDLNTQTFYCSIGTSSDPLDRIIEFREYMDEVMFQARGYRRRSRSR